MDISAENREIQSGRSMIEMLGVLAVIAVLTVGGIFGYSKAMQKYRLNTIREQVTHIIAGVKRHYANAGSFDGLTTQVAIDTGIIPDNMKIVDAVGANDSPVKHIFNGDLFIVVDDSREEPTFAVIIKNLPKDAAVDLSTANWDDSPDLVEIEMIEEAAQ